MLNFQYYIDLWKRTHFLQDLSNSDFKPSL